MKTGQDKVKSIAAGLGWSYAERIISQLVTLLVSIVLARMLSPDYYGTVTLVTVFISIGDALVTGGFGNALVQKKDADLMDFNSICWLSLAVSVLLYCLLYITAPLIATFYSQEVLTPVIRVMGIKFVVSALNSVQHAYMQRNMLFRKSFIASLAGVLLSAVMGIGLASLGFGVWALVVQYITNAVVRTIVLLCLLDWHPSFELSFQRIKGLWRFGAKVLGSTLVFTVRDNIRTLLIGKRFSAADLAFYNQGQKYPALLVNDIVSSLGTVLYPVMSNKQDDVSSVKFMVKHAICSSTYILTPMLVGLFVVSDSFVRVLLTEQWLPCVPFMRIMCVVYSTRCITTVYQKALLALGKSELFLFHESVTSVLTILLMLIAIVCYQSVMLIAISQIAVMLVGLFMYISWGKRHINYTLSDIISDCSPAIGLACAMAMVVFAIGRLPLEGFAQLCIQVIGGIVVYVGLSIVTKNTAFYEILRLLKGKLKKKRKGTVG